MSSSAPLDAFTDSYRELVGFVARRTGSRQEAQDVVHDAWLRVAEHAGRSEDPPAPQQLAPRAYLYTVAERLVIDRQRRASRTAERFCPDYTPGGEGLSVDVADAHSHREALMAVDAALAALPVRCRAIFLADRLDGAAHAEIAQQHGVSVKTVEREVMRAMDAVELALRHWRGDAALAQAAGLRRAGRRRALSSLLGLAGAGAGGAALWQAWRQWVPSWEIALDTGVGRLRTQPLPDGSTLSLDALGSAEVCYYAVRRHVRLRAGTAFFAVVADAARPFTVEAAGARVTVLGTRFETALDADGSLQVAVEEGRVRVELPVPEGGSRHELLAGEVLRWSPGGTVRRETAPGPVAAWRQGWLDFHHVPLGEAVQRLARYSSQPLRVDAAAAALPVFGRVRIADAAGWLRLLPRSLPVSVREQEEGAQRVLLIQRR